MATGCIRKDLSLEDREYLDFKQLMSLKSNGPLWMYQKKICQVKGIYNHLVYFFSKKQHEKKIKKRINRLVTTIDHNSPHTLLLYQDKLRSLFFKKLVKTPYSREKISLDGPLEAVLCPDLRREEEARHRVVIEVQFSIDLGLLPQLASSGTTGTYFLTDRKGKKRGVFKPVKEGTFGSDNPRPLRWLKRQFHYTGIRPKEIDLAEKAASRLDMHLHLGIVPLTDRIALRNPRTEQTQIGSFQFFSKGKEASRVFHFSFLFRLLPRTILRWILFLPLIKKRVEARTPRNFEKLALLDLLLFNYDRNFGNWLIREKDNKKTSEVVAIDNGGTSFPTEHPSLYVNFFKWYFDRRHRYFWEILPAADKLFSSKLQQVILKLNTEELAYVLRPHLVDWTRPYTLKSFEKKMKCLKERVQDLQKHVKKGMTIRQIALKNFYV